MLTSELISWKNKISSLVTMSYQSRHRDVLEGLEKIELNLNKQMGIRKCEGQDRKMTKEQEKQKKVEEKEIKNAEVVEKW